MERTHRRLVVWVVAFAVLTIAGMVLLWPRAEELPAPTAPPEPLVDGRIVAVEEFECPEDPALGETGGCVRLEVEVLAGPEAGEVVVIETPQEGYPAFAVGDDVKLARSEFDDGTVHYFVADFARIGPLVWLLLLFVAAVLAIGRWRGLRSLIGLALSLVVVTKFVVPAILAGRSPFLVAIVGALAVMLVTLYLSHGINEMTTAAVIGTSAALAVTVLLGQVFVGVAKLTGFSSEEANLARFAVEGLDLQGLVLAGLIIGALGVLDDVTVSQASTVFAVHAANPRQSWGEVFRRAMGVGRDHIASTVNTLFLAYVGASLALLVLFSTGGLPIGEIVNSEVLAEEITKTLVGSLGLVSAVPLTTALATSMAVRRPAHRLGDAGAQLEAAVAHGASPEPEPVDPDADDEERAYRSWIRFLREGRADEDDGAP